MEVMAKVNQAMLDDISISWEEKDFQVIKSRSFINAKLKFAHLISSSLEKASKGERSTWALYPIGLYLLALKLNPTFRSKLI